MFDLIGDLFEFVFGIVKMCFNIAGDLLEFAFDILGGIFSFVLGLGGFLLAGALVLVAIFRRSEYKKRKSHPYQEGESRTYDVDSEEFTSFYDQFRSEE